MSDAKIKIAFTAAVKFCGYEMTAEKASSAVLISSVREGNKYVNKAAPNAQMIAEISFDFRYGASESSSPSVRVSEQICKNTESPDHPPAPAARIMPSLGFPTEVQAAHPEVSSKKE